MKQNMSVLTSQASNEWYTPSGVIELARATMGSIDLDPASSDFAQRWIKAEKYYTLNLNDFRADPNWTKEKLAFELKKESQRQLYSQPSWRGNIWLNPPFNDTPSWVEMWLAARESASQGMLLVNSAFGYNWYEDMYRRVPVCLLRKRLCFVNEHGIADPSKQAKKGQTVAYFGPNVDRFSELWTKYGRILPPCI